MNDSKVLTGRIVLPDGVRWGGLWIRGGKIAGLLSADALDTFHTIGVEIIDHGDAFLMPGWIEVHGRLGEPGLTEREDYESGTRAALAGGVTTVLDMPDTLPPTTSLETLRDKAALVRGRAYCDYGFLFGATPDNARELRKLGKTEAIAVNFFTGGSGSLTFHSMDELRTGLRCLKNKGLVALIHAQIGPGQAFSNQLNAEALTLCGSIGVPAYVCHVQTQEELAEVRVARMRGATVYAEVVGLHLTTSPEMARAADSKMKASLSPASPERGAVWEALRAGAIDTLSSEHSPLTLDERRDSITLTPSGVPGLQETLPMVYTAYRAQFPELPAERILHRLAQLGSTNVAEIFGLSGKGSLMPGKDADIAVIQVDYPWVFTEDMIYSKCGWSAYAGMTAAARPIGTYLRGELVQRDGEILGTPQGLQIRRAPATQT